MYSCMALIIVFTNLYTNINNIYKVVIMESMMIWEVRTHHGLYSYSIAATAMLTCDLIKIGCEK